jgi:hypothetical protein
VRNLPARVPAVASMGGSQMTCHGLLGLAAATAKKIYGRQGTSQDAIDAAAMAVDVLLEDLNNYFQIVKVHVSAQAAFAVGFLARDSLFWPGLNKRATSDAVEDMRQSWSCATAFCLTERVNIESLL